MKVLNLRCANGHGFEGWFGSEDDFLDQNGRGLIECPLCADKVVTRMPSAPRLNLSGAREPERALAAPQVPGGRVEGPGASPDARAQQLMGDLHQRWVQAVQHVLANTEDVGERFAEEARRMHYGETEDRGIRGVTSADERQALREEGIEVVSLPLPAALKGPVQ